MQCVPTSSLTQLSVNVVLHVGIIFLFLSVFYALYGSKVESRSATKKFQELIEKDVGKILKEGDAASGGLLKKGLQPMVPALDVLESRYSRQADDTTSVGNRWLLGTALGVSGGLIAALVLFLVVLKLSCGQCPTSFMWSMLFTSFVIFLAVMAIEYQFFTHIALKLIPAPPSIILGGVIDKMREDVL
jgi:hypothetical protein